MESVIFILFLLADPAGGADQGVLVATAHPASPEGAAAVAAGFEKELAREPGGRGNRSVAVAWRPEEGVEALAGRAPGEASYIVAITCRDSCAAAVTRQGSGAVHAVEGPLKPEEVGVVAARVVRTMMTLPAIAPAPPAPVPAVESTVPPPSPPAPALLFVSVAAGASFDRPSSGDGPSPGAMLSLGAGYRLRPSWEVQAGASFTFAPTFGHKGDEVTPNTLAFDAGPAFTWRTGRWTLEAAAGALLAVTIVDWSVRGERGGDTLVNGGLYLGPSVRCRLHDRLFVFATARGALLPFTVAWERAGARYETPLITGSLLGGAGINIF